MKLHLAAIFCGFSFIVSCTTYKPLTVEERATQHTNAVSAAISKGDNAAYQIESALSYPTGNEKIRELFNNQPQNREYYRSFLEKSISNISSAYQASIVFKQISTAQSAGIFPDDQMAALLNKLSSTITNANINGTIPFDFGDDIDSFPELKTQEHQQIIANRTIKNLQDPNWTSRPIPALVNYTQQIGIDSNEGKRIIALLPTMHIKKSELDAISKISPKFTEIRKNEIIARVFLEIKNGDRLLKDDVQQILSNKIRGIEWLQSSDPNAITLTIERVRHDEKTLPERTQTISYSQHEVNFFAGALLMPKNASYLYEVVSGGIEIEYGYVISASKNGGQLFDKVVRGKATNEYRRCQNARIQNVFGGVSPADFTANDHMQKQCSGSNASSIDTLRQNIFEKIADEALNVPPIKNAHKLN